MADYLAMSGITAYGTVTQYRAVILYASANGQVQAVSNANASRPIGILQNDPADGEAADVAITGVCKAEYGGDVTRGQTLICDDSGRLIADTEVADGSAVDVHHLADAIESGAVGEIHLVVLHTPIRIGKE